MNWRASASLSFQRDLQESLAWLLAYGNTLHIVYYDYVMHVTNVHIIYQLPIRVVQEL